MRTTVYTAALALAAPVFADSKCSNVKVQDVTANIDCPTVTGDLTIPTGLGGDVSISGIKKVTGNVVVKENQGITGLTISDLTEVGDTVDIQRNNVLGNIRMDKLDTINKLSLISLQQLATIGFGSEGNTEAKTVEVSDTSLSDLSGLNLAKVDTLKITTNSQLKIFNSDLKKIGDTLIFNKNGKNMEVNMTVLEEAQDITVAGSVASFSVPSLKKISALRFTDNPNLETFEAKNLTQVGENAKKTGSISFIGNDKLSNVSFPGVSKIFGDLTVKNNTAMTELNGFPKLETIFGALLIAGDFKDIELPKLTRIDGAATVTSTQDISKFCDDGFKTFDAQSTKNQCKGKNEKANSAKNGDTLGGSNSGDDKKDAANAAVVSMTTLAAAVFIGIFQML